MKSVFLVLMLTTCVLSQPSNRLTYLNQMLKLRVDNLLIKKELHTINTSTADRYPEIYQSIDTLKTVIDQSKSISTNALLLYNKYLLEDLVAQAELLKKISVGIESRLNQIELNNQKIKKLKKLLTSLSP